jgi:hypothetical protein
MDREGSSTVREIAVGSPYRNQKWKDESRLKKYKKDFKKKMV